MRIVIDAQSLLEPMAGIGRCTISMLKALGQVDSTNQYYLYYGASFRQKRSSLPHFDNPNFHKKLLKFPGRIFRFLTEKTHLIPIGTFFRGYDIYHGLNYYVPALNLPSIVNIYDLSYILFPQCFTRKRLNDIRWKVASSIKRAGRIITGSESAKADIVNLLGVPEEKVRVICFGVEDTFNPKRGGEIAAFRKKYRFPEKFVLFVGTIEPRKNIKKLIHAYNKLNLKDTGLVIAGRCGWLFEETFREVKKLNLGDRVFFPGHIPEIDLPLLYSSASVFVFPSIYEGFGFPPLEAMACGTPVISSNTSSLPEIVGSAGILINPEDENKLAEAIESVLEDNVKREEMAAKGLEQAKLFSWEKCAKETLELYCEAANVGV